MSRKPMVIKADSPERVETLGLKTFRLVDVLEQAKATVTTAKIEAAQIRKTAQQEAERLRDVAWQEGKQDGYEAGFKEGREAGRQEAFAQSKQEFADQQKSLIGTCQAVIEGINADRLAWKTAAHHDLVELAMVIARKVAHVVGQREREVVLGNLEQAITAVGSRSEVTIVVNPADAKSAEAFAQGLTRGQECWEHVRIHAESEVLPGGCLIRWGSGSVDATLETQLNRIAEQLQVETPKQDA